MPEPSDTTAQNLRHLLEVSRSLSAQIQFEPLLQGLVASAASLTNSESASILVFDPSSQSLRFLSAPYDALNKMKIVSVPVDGSVAGWVFSNNQPYTLHHAEQDERIHRVTDRELDFTTRSLCAVPMSFRGQVIGVLEAVNKRNNAVYNQEDIFALEVIASQAAIAVQNQQYLQDIQAAYQKAIELERMKGDFIAIASHELRTPLGVILGHASYLLETASEDQHSQLDSIVRSAMRLKDIIEGLSNLDHFEHGLSRAQMESICIQQVVREVAGGVENLAKENGVRVSLDLPDEEIWMQGDAKKIAIALREVIKNSLTFTDSGGQVRIKCELVPGYVRISVIDTGIGIPPEEKEAIFQRFYQVEKHLTRRHGGMGLGLSIAKDMIELHGGRIWVESVESRGTRVSLLLPLHAI